MPATRREFLGALAAATLAPCPRVALAQPREPILRTIPASGEKLPAIGVGSWVTFNVGTAPAARARLVPVMQTFLDRGGAMIDSSPMYGSSQDVIGSALAGLGMPPTLFSAEKVWIAPGARGPAQIAQSQAAWRVARFDLLQVHNLLAWQEHLPALYAMKAAGRIRYVGITTSEGRRHAEVEQIMAREPIDFVQVTYNVLDREVEQRILPLARERRIGVIANRPFREGALLRQLARHPLPAWAAEIGCTTWAQAVLKFIVAHPDVTCAIPATTSVAHVRENLAAASAPLPDAALRRRIAADVGKL